MTQDKIIEDFRENFKRRLHEFIKTRHDKIDNIADWKISGISTRKNICVQFRRDCNMLIFSMPLPAKELSADQQENLRLCINEESIAAGFSPHKMRKNLLSADIMQNMHKADPEAWRIFVDKHAANITKKIGQYLDKSGNKTILEAEDIANNVLWELFRQARDGQLKSDRSFHSVIGRKLLRETWLIERNKFNPMRKQSDTIDTDIPEYPDDEGDTGIGTRLQEELPRIMETARKKMNATQREMLDIITANSDKGISLAKIAEIKGCAPENARQQVDKIMKKIHTAAKSLGYEETSSLIGWLMHANDPKHGIILRER